MPISPASVDPIHVTACKRRKMRLGRYSRVILKHVYTAIGEPAGLRVDKQGIPTNAPMWQLAMAKRIVTECYRLQGMEADLGVEILTFLDEILARLKKDHPRLNLQGIVEGLPVAAAKVGGFGPWRHKRIEKLRFLYVADEMRLLENNGVDCRMVSRDNGVADLVSRRSWDYDRIREASVEDILNAIYVGPGECP